MFAIANQRRNINSLFVSLWLRMRARLFIVRGVNFMAQFYHKPNQLRVAEQNLALDVVFTNVMTTFDASLAIGTHWKDSSKKVRGKKPTTILITFCPFCGTKASKESEK